MRPHLQSTLQQVGNTTEQNRQQRDPPDGDNKHEESSIKQPDLSRSTVKFKPVLSKPEDTTYMTETTDNSQIHTR